MNSFIDLFLSMLRESFNLLSSIHFFGFSLLTYFIALFVLLAVVPLIIAIVNTQTTKANGKGEIIIRKSRNAVKKKTDEFDSWISDVYREEY